MPRALQGIEFFRSEFKTEFLGIKLDTPIIQAPMAARACSSTRRSCHSKRYGESGLYFLIKYLW